MYEEELRPEYHSYKIYLCEKMRGQEPAYSIFSISLKNESYGSVKILVDQNSFQIMKWNFFLAITMIMLSCTNSGKDSDQNNDSEAAKFKEGSFGYDLNFLKKYHKDLVVLGDDSSGASVLIVPGYQGRVMTSTASGNSGPSFGWVNHELIATGKPTPHMSAFGGEDRLWLGPEGGQFSVFFKKGTEFVFDNWFVPKEFDTEPFDLVSSDRLHAKFEKTMHLENYSATQFDLKLNRDIHLLNKNEIDSALGMSVPSDVKVVAFESDNTITNKGKKAWDKKSGMLSLWVLGMLNASDETTVVLPYQQGDSTKLGKIVTTDYFGTIPSDRIKIDNGKIFFKADAKYRSKIGLSPSRALPVLGSYDPVNSTLTIVQFDLPAGAKDYVNSLWKLQKDPFSGDAVNSYNDGPIDGKQMGKFYEVESSSPAAALAPGASISHWQRTFHIQGSKEMLDQLSQKVFGIGVDAIRM